MVLELWPHPGQGTVSHWGRGLFQPSPQTSLHQRGAPDGCRWGGVGGCLPLLLLLPAQNPSQVTDRRLPASGVVGQEQGTNREQPRLSTRWSGSSSPELLPSGIRNLGTRPQGGRQTKVRGAAGGHSLLLLILFTAILQGRGHKNHFSLNRGGSTSH